VPRPDDQLPTTAYAVLALLELRPWTGYELTHQAKRSLHFVWPKAESQLYAQPPRLVEAGLAHVDVEEAGGRTRKRYSITPAGREALAHWATTVPSEPRFEAEPLLRVAFANLGSVEDASRSVEALRVWARHDFDTGLAAMESHATGTRPFPERDHINVLLGHLFGNLSRCILEWCELADEEMSRWRAIDDPGPAARTAELLADLLTQAHELQSRLDARQPHSKAELVD
jgi:DNA-binding PadR family transcriptional regulator